MTLAGRVIENTIAVARRGRIRSKWKLLLNYFRILLLNAVTARFSRRSHRNANVLGNRVLFQDSQTFVSLFEEIFVANTYLVRLSTDVPRIIDCGANIGMSILYFKMIWPAAHILAFEPDPETFGILQKNVERNSLPDVHLVNQAISGHEGEAPLYYHDDRAGAATASLVSARGGTRSRVVPTTRLSSFIDAPVDLLKLDVEGAEFDVLRDLAVTHKIDLIGRLVIEYHHNIESGRDRLSEMLDLLERNGFGYQIETRPLKRPIRERSFQDVLLYAYSD